MQLLVMVKVKHGTAMVVSLLVKTVYDKCGVPKQVCLTHECINGKVTCIVVYDNFRGRRPPGIQDLKHTTSRLTLMHCIETNNPGTVQTKPSQYTCCTCMLPVRILGTYVLQVPHTTHTLVTPQMSNHRHVGVVVPCRIIGIHVWVLLTSR